MKKINRKYLFGDECSSKILDFAEQQEYFSDRKLEIRTYDDATCLPPLKYLGPYSNPSYNGGITDNQGLYILAGTSKTFMDSSVEKNGNIIQKYRMYGTYEFEDCDYIDETVFYGGWCTRQWGHFLLECICRLYPIAKNPEKYKDIKVVFLQPVDDYEIDGSYLEILELIGLKREQVVFLRKPTKFKSVIVADTCSEAGIFYTREYKFLINHLIQKAMEKPLKIKTHKKIYLSRKNWVFTDRDIGEDKIESFFNKNGFVSISPEKYTAVEQIHLMQNAEHVVCAVSTLPHNLLFAKDGIKATFINKICLPNLLQFLVDDVKNLDVTYIDAYRTLYPVHVGKGPFLFCVNKNLINYAKDNNMKMPDVFGPDKEDFLTYIRLVFSKINHLSEEEFLVLNSLFQNNTQDDFIFYSPKELMFKKYFHKIMWKLSFGKKKFHLEKYVKYKMELKKLEDEYYQ